MEQEFVVYDNKWFYQHPVYINYFANEDGEIYSKKSNCILKTRLNRGGYLRVNIYKDKKMIEGKVHRIVYECFNGLVPEGYTIDHLNINKTDNHIDNLSPRTASEQQINRSGMRGIKYEFVDVLPEDATEINNYNTHELQDFYYSKSTDKFYWKTGIRYRIMYESKDGRMSYKGIKLGARKLRQLANMQ